MIQQSVFPIIPVEKYSLSDFIVSCSNRDAFNTIVNWPNEIWGGKPYDKTMLLLGPKSSGKTFLSKVWQQRGGELSLQAQQQVIEDIDQIKSEEELLHIFNSAHEEGRYLLLTASSFPRYNLPDLSSRINSVNKIDIAYPDDELIKMLIFKIFSNHSIKVDTDVIHFLLKILPREFSSIHNAIEMINKRALAAGRKVTIPFVKGCL